MYHPEVSSWVLWNGTNDMPGTKYGSTYMEHDPLEFMRHFPKRAPFVHDYEALYRRMVDARIVATPWEERKDTRRWRSGPCLTNLGYQVKKIIDTQSMNFFGIEWALGMWPLEQLVERTEALREYMKLFQLDYRAHEVQQYVQDRVKSGRECGYVTRWMDHEGQAVFDTSWVYPASPDLLELMAELEEALRELTELL